jgi:hypothetical protein
MGARIEQLEQRIARQREELGDDLETLAAKARTLTDWRAQFDAHPLVAIGIAAGGGMLLAAFLSPPRRRRATGAPEPVRSQAPPSNGDGLLGDIRRAVGAVATATAVEFLTEAIPGLHGHLRHRTETDAP